MHRVSSAYSPVALRDSIHGELVVKLTRLRAIRERKAFTQAELAQRARMSRVQVARLEAGTDQPRPSTVRKLAAVLGVEPEALMEPLA